MIDNNPLSRRKVFHVEDTTNIKASTAGWNGKTLQGLPFKIGVGFATTHYFTGLIDYVKVYNTALVSSDMVALYNETYAATNPVMEYLFNDDPQDSKVVNGDIICGWQSREGDRYLFNQPTAANRCTWVESFVNNPVVSFPTTLAYMYKDSPILNGAKGVIFAVYSKPTANDTYIFWQGNYTTSVELSGIAYNADYVQWYCQTNTGTTTVANVKGSTQLTTTNYMLHIFGSDGSSYFARSKGVIRSLSVTGCSSGNWFGDISGRNRIALGTGFRNSSLFACFGGGKIAELIVYDGTELTPTIITNIERYLLTKYGIST